MNQYIEANSSENEADILTAIQIGWLVVETFGRLRRYQSASRKPKSREGDKTKPFDFSINETMILDELVWSINQLHSRVDKAKLPPPPYLKEQELIQQLGDDLDLDVLHKELNDWSRQVWSLFNVEDGVMGQAFFYGGSLANTYWYPVMDWSNDETVKKFLNPYRLDYIGTQFEIIAKALPPHMAHILGYSLHKWSNIDLDLVERQKLKSRLEAQQKVWHDLLFGRRSAESYLRTGHYRFINMCSNGVRIGLALTLIAFVAIAGYGVGTLLDGGSLFDSDNTTNWSAFFAAISSFVLVISGLVTRFSSWIKLSGDFVEGKVKQQLILINTYRDWKTNKDTA